jgi:hypothetical protein
MPLAVSIRIARTAPFYGAAALAVLLLAVITAPAFAHHSPSAFDRSRQITVTGVVKAFKWQNPHSWMEVEVADDKGGSQTWGIEMTSPTFLIRAGWTSKTVKPGDKVTVTAHPVRTGEPGGMFVNVTLPDGRVLGDKPARLGAQ